MEFTESAGVRPESADNNFRTEDALRWGPMPAMLLSGFISPVDNMPKVLQYITYLNPIRFFMVLTKGIFLKNNRKMDYTHSSRNGEDPLNEIEMGNDDVINHYIIYLTYFMYLFVMCTSYRDNK